MGGLANLTHLDLSGNNPLTGEIPADLGNLTSLIRLDLSYNDLSGSVPGALGGLSSLEYLYLNNNRLDGDIQSGLGGLGSLIGLYLQDNNLEGEIPDDLGDLTSLTHLYLQNNELEGEMPATLGGLASLREMRIDNNLLEGEIPASLGSLAALTTLRLNNNLLEGEIPASLGDLPALRVLWLHVNQLTGEIPGSLGNPANLQHLVLSDNQLTGEIPAWVGSLTRLRYVYLHNNLLTGEIPPSLGSLTDLLYLLLSANDLEGPIPSTLGSLSNLQRLWLHNNLLTGEIPSSLGNLAALQHLVLRGNRLEGEIPSALGGLGNTLTDTYIAANDDLTGCIPTAWMSIANNDFAESGLGFCSAPPRPALTPGNEKLEVSWTAPADDRGSAITAYDVRHIRTDAEDRAEANWTDVDTAWVTGGGALAYAITGLTNGVSYDVQVRAVNSESDGPWSPTATGVPGDSDRAILEALYDATGGDSWTNNTNWKTDRPLGDWYGVNTTSSGEVFSIALPNNNLSGSIPAELGDLAKMEELKLTRNQLSGPMPAALGNLSNLRVLRISLTQLSGEIPEELGNLANLEALALAANDLSGGIPSRLGSLASLRELQIQQNRLSGEVPPALGSLGGLEKVRLARNLLSGCLPSQWKDIPDNDFAKANLNFCDDDGEWTPPRQGAPRVTAIDSYSLRVEWVDPGVTDNGRIITRYDLRWREAGTRSWTVMSKARERIGGRLPPNRFLIDLKEGTPYQVQVRPVTAAGRGPWSPSGTGTTEGTYDHAPTFNEADSTTRTVAENTAAGENIGNAVLATDVDAGDTLTYTLSGKDARFFSLSGEGQLQTRAPLDYESKQTYWVAVRVSDGRGGRDSIGVKILVTDVAEDRDALVALYDATGGSGWSNNDNWNTAAPIDQWHGVTVDGEGRVTSLKLKKNGLSGELPSELGDLAMLEELNLTQNGLTGSIPAALGNLSNLRDLRMAVNDLSGEIPSALGDLANLEVLVLAGNDLIGEIPSQLGSLANLTRVLLGGNELAGCIPADWEDVAENDFAKLGLPFCED